MIRIAAVIVGGLVLASSFWLDWVMTTITFAGCALLYIFGPRR